MRFSTDFGFYELNPFPGCNQLVISNHAFVRPEHRGNGHGKDTARYRIAHAQELGYDYMICTVLRDNVPQQKIMVDLGWTELDYFLNSETNKEVVIFGRTLS